ncbi:MAG: SurA N-terminal domain-containing protein [Alphaproteobacteria bacterium]|nr:SurA N-terminal domain-containing protein [Alphaproteobacteria bacterium]
MSLLDRMRSGSDSTAMQLVFFAVAASFVFLGLGVTGNTTTTVASVNGEPISAITLGRAVESAERQASRDRAMSEDERRDLRERVLQDLIRERALVQEAVALGLQVSNKEIAEELLQIPFLTDEEGTFDKRAYQNFLRRMGLTRADFEEQIREQLLVRKLSDLMKLGASVSSTAAERDWLEQNTQLDVSFVRIRPSAIASHLEPDDAAIDTYLSEHPDAITARYERDLAAKYDQPEKVDVRLVRLAVRDDGLTLAELKTRLDKVRAEAEGGADLAALARRWSEDPSAQRGGLLEEVVVRDLDDRAAAALADLGDGDLSPVVVGDDDVRFYRLEARVEARTLSKDEVARDIATALWREEQAPTRAAEIAEQEILPAWTAAETPPKEVLQAYGLSVQSTGLVSAVGGSASLFRPPADLMKAARSAQPGEVLGEVFEDDGVVWVGALSARQDPDTAKLEEDADEIREQALLRRRVAFYQAWADDVVARASVTR